MTNQYDSMEQTFKDARMRQAIVNASKTMAAKGLSNEDARKAVSEVIREMSKSQQERDGYLAILDSVIPPTEKPRANGMVIAPCTC